MPNYPLNSILICKYDAKKPHLIKEPKKLPCNKSACFECLHAAINDRSEFKCNFCLKKHKFTKDLRRDIALEYLIEDSLPNISEDFLSDLKSNNKSSIDFLKNVKEKLSIQLTFLREEIEIRTQSLIEDLEILRKALNDDISTKTSKFKAKNKKFHLIINRTINRKNDTDFSYVNFEKIQRFHRNISRKKFKPYEKILQIADIGVFNSGSIGEDVDLYEIEKRIPKLIRCNFHLNAICNLFNEHIAISDSLLSTVFILNKKFEIINSVSSIGSCAFNSPSGICTDFLDIVYICDKNGGCVISSDSTLSQLKSIIRENLQKPKDVFYYEKSLFILEAISKEVKQLRVNGELLRRFNMSELMPLTGIWFRSVRAFNKSLAITLNDGRLLVYNYEKGCLLNEEFITVSDVNSLMISTSRIFVHNYSNDLIGYDYEESCLKELFKIHLNRIENSHQLSSMINFNKRIVLALEHIGILVV